MKIKVICEVYIDVDVHKPDFWNSDTIDEYKEDLLSEIGNTAMQQIWDNSIGKIGEELKIIEAEPYEDGCEEFDSTLKDWQIHYDNRPNDLKYDKRRSGNKNEQRYLE